MAGSGSNGTSANAIVAHQKNNRETHRHSIGNLRRARVRENDFAKRREPDEER